MSAGLLRYLCQTWSCDLKKEAVQLSLEAKGKETQIESNEHLQVASSSLAKTKKKTNKIPSMVKFIQIGYI